jgi:hypothetical protein
MQTQVIPQSVENLGILAEDFARHLRAENTSPKTIKTYLEAVRGWMGSSQRPGFHDREQVVGPREGEGPPRSKVA